MKLIQKSLLVVLFLYEIYLMNADGSGEDFITDNS